MAAYSAPDINSYVTERDLILRSNNNDPVIVSVSSTNLKAGTPMPWLNRITAGGSGNGGTNYTGSPASYDNFNACVVTGTNKQVFTTSVIEKNQMAEMAVDNGLQMFPNPAGSFVNLSFVPVVKGAVTLRVYTADGALKHNIHQGLLEANQLYTKRIDTQSWPKGIYTIQLTLKDQVINRKLVIIR
jgi:hypothetical protein